MFLASASGPGVTKFGLDASLVTLVGVDISWGLVEVSPRCGTTCTSLAAVKVDPGLLRVTGDGVVWTAVVTALVTVVGTVTPVGFVSLGVSSVWDLLVTARAVNL